MALEYTHAVQYGNKEVPCTVEYYETCVELIKLRKRFPNALTRDRSVDMQLCELEKTLSNLRMLGCLQGKR